MSRSEPLDGLLRHPALWRAGQLGQTPETVSSGHPGLDERLPGGGWPRAGLAELLLATAGIGELRLLLPLLRTLSREPRCIAWVNPPFLPYAPALEAAGVDIRKILLIHPRSHAEALWAAERASRSGVSSLVLAWLDERRLELTDTRRLLLAARQGRTLACLFRPERVAAGSSMAELRLRLAPAPERAMVVDIVKRRGGWPVSGLELRLDEGTSRQAVQAQLSLWRQCRPLPPPAPQADGDGGDLQHPVGASREVVAERSRVIH